MAKTANEIWRDFETEGVPASGAHKPIKADIREWGTQFETLGGFNAPGADTSAALFSAGLGVAAVFRHIVGFDLPNPSTTTPGAVFAKPGAAGQVLSGLGTDGEFDVMAAVGTGNVLLSTNPIVGGTIFFEPFQPFATGTPTGNNIIYGPDGRLALQLQNNAAFYKSNTHQWSNNDGTDVFGTLNQFTFDLQPATLTGTAVNPAFTLTQTINNSAQTFCVDWRFITTALNATSRAFRIRGGAAGNTELYSFNLDFNNPVFFMSGRAVLSAPPGQPTTIYASTLGTGFANSAGSKILTSISNTGVWTFAGDTSGTHTLAAAAAASGASTFPNASGELINTGSAGFPQSNFGVAVDFNVVGDNPIPIKLPTGSTRFRITNVQVINTGPGAASLTTAQMAVFTGAGGTGTTIVTPQALSALTSNANGVNGAFLGLTNALGTAVWDIATTSQIFARVTTAQGAAAAGRAICSIQPLP